MEEETEAQRGLGICLRPPSWGGTISQYADTLQSPQAKEQAEWLGAVLSIPQVEN